MAIWDLVAAPILKIVDKLVPDRAAAQAMKDQLNQIAVQGQLQEELADLQAVTTAQTDINKIEAASTNWWVSGWRPYIGWICGTGLAMSAIIGPFFNWLTILFHHPLTFPVPSDPLLQSTLAGLLGMGHISRTIEKIQGVAAK